MTVTRVIALTSVMVLGTLAGTAVAQPARFEVTSIKAIRPTLVNTIAALQKKDIQAAKEAFEAYDSGWNGVEVYVNVRHPDMYKELEGGFQNRITMGLNSPNPDAAALLMEAKAMLARFDEEVAAMEKAPPLNRLFDDVARLRIVRAHLREVTPALKAGKLAKAKESFATFDDNWDSIEDLIKARNTDSYVAIEKGMIEIEKALKPDKPDVPQATAMVNEVMRLYNEALAEVVKDARARQ